MASKLNFRARTLDASKPLNIYHLEDLPELTDLNAISRSVPEMPSGMEKEEEAEKHLQGWVHSLVEFDICNLEVRFWPNFIKFEWICS